MGLPQWRFASRLARREVRRRPGRSLLVVLLIAVPVFGMTIGSVLLRTHDANADPVARWWRAGTDIVVEEPLDAVVDLGEGMPRDAEVSTIIRADWAPIVDADGTVVQGVAIEDPGSGTPSRSVTVTSGGLPQPGEVWLSQSLADRLGVDVGDRVTLDHPAGTWSVAGTGRVDSDFGKLAVIMPDLPVEQFAGGALDRVTLFDLPADASAADIAAAGRGLDEVVSRQNPDERFDATRFLARDGQRVGD